MTSHQDIQPFVAKIFTDARTHYNWQDKPVSPQLLKDVYDLAKFGPTSANCCPLRVLFVESASAKEKLALTLAPANVDKTMAAPVTAIFAYDNEFYNELPMLFPHADAKSWFTGNAAFAEDTALRNSALQAAYFMIAARALGLDCGPMSGFDRQKTDEVFFAGTTWRSNFLCNLGYGQPDKLYPRLPRFDFDAVCKVV
ncbi:malonic semialdehyde reductase [Candidatus Finniella inopinata]|uniref:Putative NADH dehydrogenase/NAD(P)H nitroreductase EQU50_00640 n=1 Tax=Candidatus Finniella inopinata TaxID=1696036 RepID=A0A4Q7DJS1_9PROT|nr:malonic semialdehyde reductase [Candidatus Finniella inopinata]RZI47123.1 malonic semialdehyde reductase [Candidatus Finniella inopinata]